jgi:PAS domain-containing protein
LEKEYWEAVSLILINKGAYAADMARRIIQGESVDSIPIQWYSPNDYVFDYGIVKKFGLKESDLPEGSVLINKPFSFYTQYFAWILGGVFFVVFQSILLIYLGFNLSRRKKAESLLRISEERLSLALNAANEGLWDYNPQTLQIYYFSPKWYTMIGYEPYESNRPMRCFGSAFIPTIYSKRKRKSGIPSRPVVITLWNFV